MELVTIDKKTFQALLDMASAHCADYEEFMAGREQGSGVKSYIASMKNTLKKVYDMGFKVTGG